MATESHIVVATSGWSIPRASAAEFPGEGTHLERYGRRLRGAEINSCFYRPHAASTYAKWADATPAGFRFAVKLPKRSRTSCSSHTPAPRWDGSAARPA